MRELYEIVSVIESLSNEKYGSVHKMLKENNITKSAVDNMKKNPPSIPNIINFYKIAKALDVPIDFLLEGETKKIETSNHYSIDERSLIETYKELTDEGKYIVQDTIKRVWAEHHQLSKKDVTISGSSNDFRVG